MKTKTITIITISVFLINSIYAIDQEENKPKIIRTGYSIHLFEDVDIRDATVAMNMWSDELLNNLGMDFFPESKIIETKEEIINSINSNELEIISLSILDFFEIEKKTNFEPALVNTFDGQVGEIYIIVVRKDSGFKNVSSLKGKILLKPGGTIGKSMDIWLFNLLSSSNNNTKNFFKEVKTVQKPSQALLPVFFKQADACIVTKNSFLTMTELNPQLNKDLEPIEISPNYPNGLMCFNKNLSPDLKAKIIGAAKYLTKSTSGKHILKLFKSEKIIDFDNKYIIEFRKAYNFFKESEEN